MGGSYMSYIDWRERNKYRIASRYATYVFGRTLPYFQGVNTFKVLPVEDMIIEIEGKLENCFVEGYMVPRYPFTLYVNPELARKEFFATVKHEVWHSIVSICGLRLEHQVEESMADRYSK